MFLVLVYVNVFNVVFLHLLCAVCVYVLAFVSVWLKSLICCARLNVFDIVHDCLSL